MGVFRKLVGIVVGIWICLIGYSIFSFGLEARSYGHEPITVILSYGAMALGALFILVAANGVLHNLGILNGEQKQKYNESIVDDHLEVDGTVERIQVGKIEADHKGEDARTSKGSEGLTTSTSEPKKSHKWNCSCKDCKKRNEQNYIHAHYGGGHR